ncbi:uncharacterized protein [Branchiostoma lanceolatum]|uniref:uncharacterized protein n=1 Tax=Branchiostoma lanceolatum TaxID=7740 RepID=UPI003451C439
MRTSLKNLSVLSTPSEFSSSVMGSKRDKERVKPRERGSSKTSTASRRPKGGRRSAERRLSGGDGRGQEETSPKRRHVRRDGRHDSSTPSMPVLSAVPTPSGADRRRSPSAALREEGEVSSDPEKRDTRRKDGNKRGGGADGADGSQQDGEVSESEKNNNVQRSPVPVTPSGDVRISALEQGFFLLSDKLDTFQEMVMSQFDQSASRKRHTSSPEADVPEKRRRCDRGRQRSPCRDETEEESVSGGSEDGETVWKPFDPTDTVERHRWVADGIVAEETEAYFKHDRQCRGADLEAWQKKYDLPDNVPSTMVTPSFNDNVSRAVIDNDKKQEDVPGALQDAVRRSQLPLLAGPGDEGERPVVRE